MTELTPPTGAAPNVPAGQGPDGPGGRGPGGAPAGLGRLRRRMPPNLFSIAFGLAGLTEVWQASVSAIGVSQVVPNVLDLLTAVVWCGLVALYLAQGPRRILADLRDTALAPFPSLALIIGMLLSAALSRYAFTAGRVLVAVFLALTVLLGGWLTGQWIAAPMDRERMHPGYFLPTVAGGFIGAATAAQVDLHGVAEASFGIGMVCWALLGGTILTRLFFTGLPPTPLIPTLAIEVAPPAVGGLAYFSLTGGRTDLFAAALGGYTILMSVVQLRLVSLYRTLPFGPLMWAFTFSYAAVLTDAVVWMGLRHTPGIKPLTIIILVLITAFIGAVLAASVKPTVRGKLFPPLPPAEPAQPVPPVRR